MKIVGWLLLAASLAYLGDRLLTTGHRLTLPMEPLPLTAVLLAACVAYGLACAFLGLGWRWLVRGLQPDADGRAAYWVLARSQLGKYLPGNVLHYAGRMLLGPVHGLTRTAVVLGLAFETKLLLAAAFLLAIPGLLTGMRADEGLVDMEHLALAAVGCVLFIPLAALVLSRPPRMLLARLPQLEAYAGYTLGRWARLLLPALGCFLIFFALVGGMAWALGYLFWPEAVPPHVVPGIISGYAAGWVCGFVTPGSPGGIGVREAVLTGLWTPLLGAGAALALALALRVVTTGGDVVFFLSAPLSGYKPNDQAQGEGA